MCACVWRVAAHLKELALKLVGSPALRCAGQASRQEAQVSPEAAIRVLNPSPAGSRLKPQDFYDSVLKQNGLFFWDLNLCSQGLQLVR